ncbi:hypothetical protein EXIGLDRAFT_776663 [Exidia glandulosa HHB12029]|uniref:Uncharacterized protein n=1 Tax=Exidia glandulosa HHB12029 TaxID=1314781 RepID=A0A165DE32_EXIGL|nr:hypothetical protein EXIGLDRAFT_776663 [Exidia glandulosa HHB12029]
MLLANLVCGIAGHTESYTFVLTDLVGVVSLDQDLPLRDIAMALEYFHNKCPCGRVISRQRAWKVDEKLGANCRVEDFQPNKDDGIDSGVFVQTLYPDERAPAGCVNLVFAVEPPP